jgi:hypothetical protein
MPHGSISKEIFVTSVKQSGGTNNLAKGQFAVVIDKSSKDGAIAVSDFAGMTKTDKIKFRTGVADRPSGLRAGHVESIDTGYFPLESIVGIKAFAPTRVSVEVDKFEVGYDGLDPLTALFIPEEKSTVMDIQIYGQPVEIMFGRHTHNISLRVYRKKGEAMQTVVRRLVEELNSFAVPANGSQAFAGANDKLSNYLKIGITDNSNVPLAGGVAWTISSISVKDKGESNDLAKVQANYNAYKVTRSARKSGTSTYSILHPVLEVLAPFVDVEVDVEFKDCASCIVGYSQIDGGIVYHISLEDDGVDLTSAVQAIPGAVALSAVKFGNKDGKGTYSVVTTVALTQAQVTTFLTANPTAEVKNIGITNTICSKTTSTTYTWVDGETCRAKTENYKIVLEDTDCKTSRLTELQAYYPNLVITELTGATNVGGCKRTYQTSVVTNIVCAECSDIFLQPFYSEAPEQFQSAYWTKVQTPPNLTALMGFTVEGKLFNLFPEGHEEDTIPFIQTSTKIRSVAFGYKEQDYVNFYPDFLSGGTTSYDVELELAKVRQIQYAQDVNNLSQSMKGAEAVSRRHYTGEDKHKGNLFARAALGQDSLLGYNQRMIQYQVSIHDRSLSQGFGGRSDVTFTHNIVTREGIHQPLELVLNKLAAKLGLPAVNPTA